MREKYSDGETLELLNLASFLDPRFITDYIEESELTTVIDRLIDKSDSTEDQEDNVNTTEFSTSGNIVSKKRSCLNPHKVNELVFLA